jgi:hypothetical protein
MLAASDVYLRGRHGDLIAPTTLLAAPASVLLVQAGSQDTRTALALVLSGRMKPGSGSIEWNGHEDIRLLRRHAALVDSPGVNAPEPHARVKDQVREDLSLVPHARRLKLRPRRWMEEAGLDQLAGAWLDQLEPAMRLQLLCRLALADPATELLVVDSPDRHSPSPSGWLPELAALAAGSGAAVVALVAAIPDDWTGPTAAAGATGGLELNLEKTFA